MAKKNSKADFEQSASIEFEVARARLAKAHRHAERGETALAINDAIETVFDAGMVHSYGQLAANESFSDGAKDIESQAQLLIRSLAGQELRPRLAKNPKTCTQAAHKKAAESLLARATQTQVQDELISSAMNTVFHAGAAYAFSAKETERQHNLQLFNDAVKQMSTFLPVRAMNPRKPQQSLRAKLLRY